MTPSLFDYAVIVAATAGTIVYLFLMVLIVGYRRRRTFERVLFFLALAAFCVYASTLLYINALAFYGAAPYATRFVFGLLIMAGIAALPGFFIHAHVGYMDATSLRRNPGVATALVATGYICGIALLSLALYSDRRIALDLFTDTGVSPLGSDIWAAIFILALVIGVAYQLSFFRAAKTRSRSEKHFHLLLAIAFVIVAFAEYELAFGDLGGMTRNLAIVLLTGAAPGVLLLYGVARYRLASIGTQTNLVYGVTAGFLAILYLALVRRASGWLEPYFPPEATSAVLIFVLIGFFEPLQRFANRVLRRNVEQQLEQLQRMTNELQREAREGELPRFLATAEKRIREEFRLDSVGIRIEGNGAVSEQAKADERRPAWAGQPVRFPLGKQGAEISEVIAIPIGSSISGETHAALEFLAEQLPGIIELCRAVDEKSRLERELAERERLALVGQMTASISHNLKNPLGSMKTVLQVQLENPRLDESVRRDLQMVLSELDRLSGKLNALLRYARPAVRGGEVLAQIEVARVAREIIDLMENEARKRGAMLELHEAPTCGCIRGNEEALNDILSNLIVNAIEAVAADGRVNVRLGGDEREVEVVVADDGAGISAEQQMRLFQPFFTTKANGTGLGLAIVRRRATELGGTVSCRSPIADGRGAEFIVRLPRMKC